MNQKLEKLAADIGLNQPANERPRLAFAFSCVSRVRHLLEEPEVNACLAVLKDFLDGTASREALNTAGAEVARLANGHRGSKSIDGCGHAAVSATYAVAKALEGKAIEAASYAAYATVYAQGGYAAAADRESFEPEFQWQFALLESLAEKLSAGDST